MHKVHNLLWPAGLIYLLCASPHGWRAVRCSRFGTPNNVSILVPSGDRTNIVCLKVLSWISSEMTRIRNTFSTFSCIKLSFFVICRLLSVETIHDIFLFTLFTFGLIFAVITTFRLSGLHQLYDNMGNPQEILDWILYLISGDKLLPSIMCLGIGSR